MGGSMVGSMDGPTVASGSMAESPMTGSALNIVVALINQSGAMPSAYAFSPDIGEYTIGCVCISAI